MAREKLRISMAHVTRCQSLYILSLHAPNPCGESMQIYRAIRTVQGIRVSTPIERYQESCKLIVHELIVKYKGLLTLNVQAGFGE